jgi:hypothetical protein
MRVNLRDVAAGGGAARTTPFGDAMGIARLLNSSNLTI